MIGKPAVGLSGWVAVFRKDDAPPRSWRADRFIPTITRLRAQNSIFQEGAFAPFDPDRKEMTLTTKASEERSTAARARAEASFKKEERAKDGALAMTEYLANARMVRERTERLRALRLAKEEADKGREVPAAANKGKGAKKR
jgi:hypothetical protein